MPFSVSSSPSIADEVEMIGRLVEEEDVGLGRQRPGKRGAAALAARKGAPGPPRR